MEENTPFYSIFAVRIQCRSFLLHIHASSQKLCTAPMVMMKNVFYIITECKEDIGK